MSNFVKHILFGSLLFASANIWASDPSLKVYDVDVTVNEKSQTVNVALDINLKDYKVGRNGEAVFTPVIISADGSKSVELNSFTVCGRNRYYFLLRNKSIGEEFNPFYRSGKKEIIHIDQNVALEPWMLENATVEVRQQAASCCARLKDLPGDSQNGNVLVARLHSTEPTLNFDYVFSPPVEQEPVKKSVEGRAFVTFVVNRTELNPNYMKNPIELRKITNSIDVVKADPDAIITEVHIKGYASPEGSYENNVRLAKGRTETLAGYVNSLYKFAPGIMTTSYDPEDWGGLRSYVADSLNYNLTNRAGLLEIIDGPLGFDARDYALKSSYPSDYRILLTEIYPWLRHSDYEVKYTIKVYTDIQNLMRLYNSDPSKLRAVDFYTIAQQYPSGSKEYLAVMKKAVEIYPEQPMINLNVANIYLMDNDFDKAEDYLLKAGASPQADYARGVLAAKRGYYKEAVKFFESAEKGGIAQANDYIKQIDEAVNASPVEILLKTTK